MLWTLDKGYLGDDDTMIALIERQNAKHLRIPSGNEQGAYDGLWVPGGKTKGGVSEAVMNFSDKPKFREIKLK